MFVVYIRGNLRIMEKIDQIEIVERLIKLLDEGFKGDANKYRILTARILDQDIIWPRLQLHTEENIKKIHDLLNQYKGNKEISARLINKIENYDA